MELFHAIMFCPDNTTGYTQAQLDALNAELAERIRNLAELDTDAAYQAAQAFADEISRREG